MRACAIGSQGTVADQQQPFNYWLVLSDVIASYGTRPSDFGGAGFISLPKCLRARWRASQYLVLGAKAGGFAAEAAGRTAADIVQELLTQSEVATEVEEGQMNRSVFGVVIAGALLGPCDTGPTGIVNGTLVGTWGGENAGLIADDTSAHLHIACTFGNVMQGIEPGSDGHFDVAGEYVLRAYPVYVGPSLPARFQGTVAGKFLTLSVVVQDTTADTTVTLGPVKLFLGREPQMGPCPICRTPAERMTRRLVISSRSHGVP